MGYMVLLTKRFWCELTTLGVACLGLACTASTREHAANARDDQQTKAWEALGPGQRIVVFDPSKSCNAVVAPDVRRLDTEPQSVAGQPWAKGLAIFRILNSSVSSGGADAALAVTLRLAGTQGETLALRFTPGSAGSCIWPYRPEVDDLSARVGSKLVFAPWLPACTRLAVAGTSPDAQLLNADPGVTITLEALELGAAVPSALVDWKWQEPVVPWFRANGGTLHVRADTISQCFAQPGDPSASPPQDALALIRTDVSRCTTDSENGEKHVACRTSLGVWEGIANDKEVDLRLVRRTVGALHILGGHPVTGDRFARTVVAVTLGTPSQERERRLYGAMQASLARVLSGASGLIRVATAGDPAVTLTVSAAVRNLVVGELERKTVTATSQYEDHKEPRPNPDKPKVQAEVESARTALEAATESFAQRKREEEQNRQGCLDACDTQTDANLAAACRAGCALGSAITAESDTQVVAAREKLVAAQTKLGQTPDTIEVPVMQDWSYEKTVYSRSVSAALDLELGFKSGVVRDTQQLSDFVTDEEVTADDRHHVVGHAPDRDMIDRPESLLPRIGEKLAAQLATALQSAIDKEMQEAALRAFEAAGVEAGDPAYRRVDAMAFDAVGKRLRRAVQRGQSTVEPGVSSALPSAALELGPDDCILAVAVSEGDAAGALSLATPNQSHGDLRGQSFALVEVCRGELGDSRAELSLASSKRTTVRWGLYKVSQRASP